jgi:D-arabinose 1-dehydrogenase-like Zn-dependent alcohol dehydrogenase
MSDKLDAYRSGNSALPEKNRLWPLYGPGFENLGDDGGTIELPVPEIGPDELLVRHDACGLCFSDIKVIKAGQAHPRIYRDMSSNPVVLGHEVSMTIVRVGENLRDRYHVGDRFIVQADIFLDGVSYAYGYELQGGLSRYNVIDWRVLNGDHGNYLIPVQDSTGYAESALTEPWACVIAAYQLKYRTGLKPGGTCWIIGTEESRAKTYTIGAGFDENSHPARLLLTDVPQAFASWLKARASRLGIQAEEVSRIEQVPSPLESIDDIVVLGADADIIEAVSPRLANFGILAIIADRPLFRKVSVDVGRVHYNRWVYVGGKGPDVARAYSDLPVRSTLKSGGRAWFAGAGGPMGRMHVQRAIQVAERPMTILCTDVSDLRLDDLCTSYAAEAKAKGIEFICVNPTKGEQYQSTLSAFREKGGFDDIIVLAPIPALISEAAGYLAPRGVMNVFAGVTRGVAASLDLSGTYLKDTRIIGHSASTIEDLRLMLHQAETGELSPNRSIAAVGSLSAAREGLKAVNDTLFPGKVVIFPQIREFPLTALPDLKEKLPSVYAKLKHGHEWTVEAEEEFLRLMLP